MFEYAPANISATIIDAIICISNGASKKTNVKTIPPNMKRIVKAILRRLGVSPNKYFMINLL
jgi:hypothetical protein